MVNLHLTFRTRALVATDGLRSRQEHAGLVVVIPAHVLITRVLQTLQLKCFPAPNDLSKLMGVAHQWSR